MSLRRIALGIGCLAAAGYVGLVVLDRLVPDDTAGQVALAQNLLGLDAFQELVRQVVLEELKPEYTSQHDWGKQKEVGGVKLRGKWYAPRLEKTEKAENDGLWQRMVVTLVEPDENLSMRVEQAGAAPDGRVALVLTVQARLSGKGQFERWQRGVKLFDVSAESESTVLARIECELGIHREPGTLVDDIVLDPVVTAIHLQLVDLDVRRVGKLGHDVARELGNALRPTIAHELARREPKIVAKANASIDKRRAHLRFSPEQFLASGWAKFERAVLGAQPAEGVRR